MTENTGARFMVPFFFFNSSFLFRLKPIPSANKKKNKGFSLFAFESLIHHSTHTQKKKRCVQVNKKKKNSNDKEPLHVLDICRSTLPPPPFLLP